MFHSLGPCQSRVSLCKAYARYLVQVPPFEATCKIEPETWNHSHHTGTEDTLDHKHNPCTNHNTIQLMNIRFRWKGKCAKAWGSKYYKTVRLFKKKTNILKKASIAKIRSGISGNKVKKIRARIWNRYSSMKVIKVWWEKMGWLNM